MNELSWTWRNFFLKCLLLFVCVFPMSHSLPNFVPFKCKLWLMGNTQTNNSKHFKKKFRQVQLSSFTDDVHLPSYLGPSLGLGLGLGLFLSIWGSCLLAGLVLFLMLVFGTCLFAGHHLLYTTSLSPYFHPTSSWFVIFP